MMENMFPENLVYEMKKNPELFIKIMRTYGITPKQLGVTPNYINKIKNGKRSPSIKLITRLLELVNEKTGARGLAWLGRRPHTAEHYYHGSITLTRQFRQPVPSPVPLLSSNPLAMITDLETEVKEFLEYARRMFSKKYYDDMKRYIKYAFLLYDPVKFTVTLNGALPKTKILKTLANFMKYLDLKYNSSIFYDYFRMLRKKSGVKWSERNGNSSIVVPSETQLVDIISISLSKSLSVALKIWALAVSGVRPCELRLVDFSRINKEKNYIELFKESRTKRVNILALTPRLKEILIELREKKRKPFGVNRVIEYNTLKTIREKYPWFRYYCLRHFNANYLLLKGLSEPEIDFLQGRAGLTVLRQHYLHLSEDAILEKILAKHNEAFKELDEKIYRVFRRETRRE